MSHKSDSGHRAKLLNMKKLSIITATFIITASLQAQSKTISSKPIMISIGVEPSIPVGKSHDAGYIFSIGGSLQLEDKVASNLGLTISVGYHDFQQKDTTVYGTTFTPGYFGLVPLLAGVKFYFSPKIYGHAQFGTAISLGKNSNIIGSGTYFFAYSPGIGFLLSRKFDVLLKYSGFSKNSTALNLLGARIAYTF